TNNIENLKFNIAISKMMVYINHMYKINKINDIKYLKNFLILLSPFAPHISEELMEKLKEEMMEKQNWPTYDEQKTIETKIIISIQVNGKLRGTIEINGQEDEQEIIKLALENANVKKFIENKNIKKTIYIKNKNINFVI
ncbi:MAG: class I tRNA ligase family protein, partial [Mycoplasmataceae bacterium]|nr:class I tRNA ligase family protein [Mycoplasmataceae bacterium]